MARSIFISALGTTYYKKVQYGPTENDVLPSDPTRFIQIARVEALEQRGIEFQDIYIMVTEASKEANWINGQVDPNAKKEGSDPPYAGLRDQFKEIGHQLEPVNVFDGRTASELWQNFQTIASLVQPGDDVYVDITHGFRSLSIILMMSLDYVIRVQGANLVELSYGAFEAKDKSTEIVPTFDLTKFLGIRDWSSAAALLRESGDISGFAKVAKQSTSTMKKKLRLHMPESLNLLANTMTSFGDHLQQCRLRKLPEAARDVFSASRDARATVERFEEVRPLSIVLDSLEEQIHPLSPKDDSPFAKVRAQLEAARWCFRYSHFMRGFTLLRESLGDMIEVWVDQKAGLSEPRNEGRKNETEKVLSCLGFLTIPENKSKLDAPRAGWASLALDWLRNQEETVKLQSIIDAVGQTRNSLDHAGTGEGIIKTARLNKKALKALGETFDLLKTFELTRKNCTSKSSRPVKLLLVFSHSLTPAQIEEAQARWGVSGLVPLPVELGARWANVAPEAHANEELVGDILSWITREGHEGDFVLIQGEFGATYSVVASIHDADVMTPIYATTRRKVIENQQDDGTVTTERVFEHVRFRQYCR